MRKPLVIHPFLFSIWVVLIILVEEIKYIQFINIFLPIATVLFLAYSLLFIMSLIIKDFKINALIISPIIIFLLLYGIFYDYILTNFHQMGYFIVPIVTLLLISAYILYCTKLLILLSINSIIKITNIFNGVAALLIVFNVSQMLIFYYNYDNKVFFNQDERNLKYRFSGTPPDIYYIILDEYAGLEQIKSYFNYDNSDFVNRLNKKGFYVAHKSKSNYTLTSFSLATSLNMAPPRINSSGTEWSSSSMSISEFMNMTRRSPVYEYIQNNNVVHLLKSYNYKYYHLGSWLYETMYSKFADYNINYIGFNINNPLIMGLCKSSIIRLIYINRYFQRKLVMNAFSSLSNVAGANGPKFVFAHIICPHPPFLFGPEGEIVPFSKRNDVNDRMVYLGQYIFITKKIEECIDIILEKSNTPAIIILQSDHGVRWDKPSAKMIFNAYLLPHNGNAILYDNISPVNTFRLVFNYYFSAKYDLLDDGSKSPTNYSPCSKMFGEIVKFCE